MAIKLPGQLGFVDAVVAGAVGGNAALDRLSDLVKWYRFEISRQRAAVETTFATFKRRMGLSRIRYVGLIKASGQMLLAALAFNMRRWAALTP